MQRKLTAAQALMILNGLPHVGPVSVRRIRGCCGNDVRGLLSAAPSELLRMKGIGAKIADTLYNWHRYFDLNREESALKEKGAAFIPQNTADYPVLLNEIYDPPLGLYWMGDYRIDRPCIAIVGSRRCTLYGQRTARQLARDLASMGFCIVSGLARGIDSAAHEGAMEAKDGKTLAILGCGLDIIYPAENLHLYRHICSSGAIVSELPFGRRPDRQTFPMRNRIVSGMCVATVVVETDRGWGSMITAHFAGEQGRTLFAVPGRIDQSSSRGCHQLIREGAILFTTVEDILEELHYLRSSPMIKDVVEAVRRPTLPDDLDEKETRILSCFKGGEILTSDIVAARAHLPPATVTSTLVMLELKKLIVKHVDGGFEARP